MSSVLSRDIDAYQRALDQYNRSLRSYNKGVDAYNNTLVKGPNGEPVVVDDGYGVVQGQMPPGQTPNTYGRTELDGHPGMFLLRQNPTTTATERMTGVRYQQPMSDEGGGSPGYYYYNVGGYDPEGSETRTRLGGDWRMVAQTGYGEAASDNRFTMERANNTYLAKPGEWTKEFTKKAPAPTRAEYQRAQMPSLASVEAGLIGEVMRGGGLKSGVQFRPVSAGTAPNPNPPAPVAQTRPAPTTPQPSTVAREVLPDEPLPVKYQTGTVARVTV